MLDELLADARIRPFADELFHDAVRRGWASVVDHLVSSSACTLTPRDALDKALTYGQLDIANTIARAPHLFVPSSVALIAAAGGGHLHIVRLILADTRFTDGSCMPIAAQSAAAAGCLQILQEILAHPMADRRACAALALPASVGHVETCTWLLTAVPAVDTAEVWAAAIDQAAEVGKVACLQRILAGARVGAAPLVSKAAYGAAKNSRADIIDVLMADGRFDLSAGRNAALLESLRRFNFAVADQLLRDCGVRDAWLGRSGVTEHAAWQHLAQHVTADARKTLGKRFFPEWNFIQDRNPIPHLKVLMRWDRFDEACPLDELIPFTVPVGFDGAVMALLDSRFATPHHLLLALRSVKDENVLPSFCCAVLRGPPACFLSAEARAAANLRVKPRGDEGFAAWVAEQTAEYARLRYQLVDFCLAAEPSLRPKSLVGAFLDASTRYSDIETIRQILCWPGLAATDADYAIFCVLNWLQLNCPMLDELLLHPSIPLRHIYPGDAVGMLLDMHDVQSQWRKPLGADPFADSSAGGREPEANKEQCAVCETEYANYVGNRFAAAARLLIQPSILRQRDVRLASIAPMAYSNPSWHVMVAQTAAATAWRRRREAVLAWADARK